MTLQQLIKAHGRLQHKQITDILLLKDFVRDKNRKLKEEIDIKLSDINSSFHNKDKILQQIQRRFTALENQVINIKARQTTKQATKQTTRKPLSIWKTFKRYINAT
jgi:nucleoside 2-deoxyribosyltransferase|tara:strand:+ start:404 stop:721 length:318 start_codon:yes stop_codon:yes gene_type:complete